MARHRVKMRMYRLAHIRGLFLLGLLKFLWLLLGEELAGEPTPGVGWGIKTTSRLRPEAPSLWLLALARIPAQRGKVIFATVHLFVASAEVLAHRLILEMAEVMEEVDVAMVGGELGATLEMADQAQAKLMAQQAPAAVAVAVVL